MMETIIRPEGRAFDAPGVRFWAVPQIEALVGQEVEIRDWYATFSATVEGVAEVSDRTGFAAQALLTYLWCERLSEGRDNEG